MLSSQSLAPLSRRMMASHGPRLLRSSLVARKYATEAGLNIKPIAGALGVEVTGIDLTRDVSPEHKQVLNKALMDHQAIFFRDQKLSPAQYLKFTATFGNPQVWPMMKGLDDYPEIVEVLKKETDVKNYAGIWHTDSSYLPEPPKATALIATEVPPFGGDTLFANQYLAYEALSPGLQQMLSKLKGVASSQKTRATIRGTKENNIGHGISTTESLHPVVRTHPETGRKALFVNEAHTKYFEGWTKEESEPLLKFLFQHQIKPEFTCRFGWGVGSIAVWDNRCVLHNPINDYQGFRRLLYRIIIQGDRPV